MATLHCRRYRLLCIVRIVYCKFLFIADKLAVCAQYSHADRVEGSCPHVFCGILIVKRRGQSCLYLVCRLICKRDCQHPVRTTRLAGKILQHILGRGNIAISQCVLHFLNIFIVNVFGYRFIKIRISVFDYKHDTLYKHRCLSASRACQDKQRSVDRKDCVSLF